MHFLFKFEYQAQFDAAGAEHELCSVFIGRSTAQVRVNRSEILASRWISAAALLEEMAGRGNTSFTPWFMLEWKRIWHEHRSAVLALQSQPVR